MREFIDVLAEIQTWPPVYLLLLTALLGLIIGSFLNVVIHRLPLMLEYAWRRECAEMAATPEALTSQPEQEAAFNLAVPGSRCPHCGHRLKPWENIPLLSFLLLRGRCSQCQTPIGWRYPVVELLSALLGVVTVWQFGWSWQAAGALVLIWSLLALAVIDLDHHLLPDAITLPLLWLGLVLNSFQLYTSLHAALWGAISGYLLLWCIYWLFKLLTGKEGMGYGDFKLLAALGAWLGWQALPLLILLASVLGTVSGLAVMMLKGHSRHQALPFGPSLALAGAVSLFWGNTILQWYLTWVGF